MNPSRRAAIVGVGLTPQGKLPGSTNLSLETDAFKTALADSGLAKDDIDGLLSEPGTTDMHWALDYLRLGRALGINPKYTGSFAMGGATAGNLVQLAAMAVTSGMAEYVACCFGDAAKTGKRRPLQAAGGYLGVETANNGVWGAFGAATWSAITASRHMALYGTTDDQLGEVAVSARAFAAMNPAAMMRNPITLEDHHASKMIVEPFRLLDCCLVSDGGACVIVTTAERARDLRQPVITIAGMGQGFITQDHECEEWWYGPHQKAAMDRAYAMAGLGPQDVDVAELYDNFTISTILWLEHAGFCKVGEGGPFVQGGRIGPGGELPVNTHGGHLSAGHPQGWWTLIEAVEQLRGASGDRQAPDAEVALVGGRGLVLNTASALLLTGGGR
ncbi:thiolase family protein [Actinomadura syzygii]|uniref:Thiolase family protein n=1 Tax=Actinomadura syzygii TaxID=1427538 RepID=A0A5D0U631_9ACTN|nr:thiolase family protein [Actinomadura syzygii]TYC13190.1 thiolase family protein [Actinomadura syzygii]